MFRTIISVSVILSLIAPAFANETDRLDKSLFVIRPRMLDAYTFRLEACRPESATACFHIGNQLGYRLGVYDPQIDDTELLNFPTLIKGTHITRKKKSAMLGASFAVVFVTGLVASEITAIGTLGQIIVGGGTAVAVETYISSHIEELSRMHLSPDTRVKFSKNLDTVLAQVFDPSINPLNPIFYTPAEIQDINEFLQITEEIVRERLKSSSTLTQWKNKRDGL